MEATSYFSWTSIILDLSSDWVLDIKAAREIERERERGRDREVDRGWCREDETERDKGKSKAC
jgi:hypothetical protein